MLFDTTFLIDLLRGKEPAVYKITQKIEEHCETKCISSISVMELWRGAIQSDRSEGEKKKITELLSSLFVYVFDENIAKKAGEIEAQLIKSGEIIQLEDVIIAATALIHRQSILTRNTEHFKRVQGVEVETY